MKIKFLVAENPNFDIFFEKFTNVVHQKIVHRYDLCSCGDSTEIVPARYLDDRVIL